jgi:hypothetical protein
MVGAAQNHEAGIDRVPYEFIIQRRAENRRRHRAARKIVRDLMQPEQLKMIDREGAGQHDQPAHE